MGQFKDVTLNWVKVNHGTLKELPEHLILSLAVYLVDASSSACRYAGVDDRFTDTANIVLLKQLGLPENEVKGMLLAMSNPLPLGKELMFDQGGSAFSAWIRDGDAAAISGIQDAMTKWHRNNDLVGEIVSVTENGPTGLNARKPVKGKDNSITPPNTR